ncbi:hypothetical protein ACR782_10985 [Sphingobacterium spiritivorum]|uniref:hypothetical protein n=1 Tax=Sphingobacterium spiritivorum TaxID=258 RepID=UPI003DA2C955
MKITKEIYWLNRNTWLQISANNSPHTGHPEALFYRDKDNKIATESYREIKKAGFAWL